MPTLLSDCFRPLAVLAGLVALSGCSLFAQPRHESFEGMAKALRDHPPTFEALHTAAARGPRHNVLLLRESGLGGVTLGDGEALVRGRLGEPTHERVDRDGRWLDYDKDEPPTHLSLRIAGPDATVVQIRVWPPSRAETRTFMRPLDPATRLEPKYGPPASRLAWDRGEVWLYSAANVAYVLTPADEQGRRVVAGIVVGL